MNSNISKRTKLFVRLLRKSIHYAKKKKIEIIPPISLISEINSIFALPAVVTGIIYLVIFLPLTWFSCKTFNCEFTNIFLLQSVPSSVNGQFFKTLFPLWSAPEVRPLIYSFATLYGTIGIVAGLTILSGGLPKLVVTANGLITGYYLTRFFTSNILSLWRIDEISTGMFRYKILYVMLLYYSSEALTNILSKDDISKEKYKFLFQGMYGLISGWILSRGFGQNSAVFTGCIFITFTFVSIAFYERVFRLVFGVMEYFIGVSNWKAFEAEHKYSLRDLWLNFTLSWHEQRLLFCVGFAIMSIFPLLFAFIYHFMLEGRA